MDTGKYLLDYDWTALAPELTILIVGTLMSVIDLLLKDKTDRRFLAWIGMAGVIVAGIFTAVRLGGEPYQILADTYRQDAFSGTFKLIILTGTLLTLLTALSALQQRERVFRGEFYYLLLAATLGGMIMVSSADLITLYVGLELLSIASYILVGMRKFRLRSNEAAFKYIILGGVSSAFILYGMSFLYGLTGSTNLYAIRDSLPQVYTDYNAFVLISLVLMLLGFGFKISTAPFHMWAPDVYEGAPTPTTAFLSVVSKTAAFAFLIRFLFIAYGGLFDTVSSGTVWSDRIALFLAILAGLSMIIGNTIALRQRNLKRLMAYSTVAHAGYILIPLATLGPHFVEAISFYLLAYVFMNVGAFAVIMLVMRDTGSADIAAFSGLYRRAPWTALAMLVFVLSLAGIPLTGGFFGKFYIFFNAILVQGFWLAGLLVVTSIISYFYYFEIVRQMFFRPARQSGNLRIPFGLAATITLGVLGTIALGVLPQYIVDTLHHLDPLGAFISTGQE